MMKRFYGNDSFLRQDLRKFRLPTYPKVWEAYDKYVEVGEDTIRVLEVIVNDSMGETNLMALPVICLHIPIENNGVWTEETMYIESGVDTETVVRDFAALYGERMLALPFERGVLGPYSDPGLDTASHGSMQTLAMRVRAILDKNIYKYLKLIEFYGFDIEPKNTHEEVYNEGKAQGTVHIGHNVNETQNIYTNVEKTHQTSSYDGALKDEWKETENGGALDNRSHTTGTAVNNSDQTSFNAIDESITFNDDSKIIVPSTPSIKLHDFKVVKHIVSDKNPREFMELISAETSALRNSLEHEFFEDIAKEILLCTY